MKKIIMILTNRYDPDVRVYKEAKYLVKQGYSVEILCWDRESNYPNEEFVINEGIKIKRFYPYAKYGSGIKQLIPFRKFSKEVNEYLKDKEFDYIHCHDLDGAIVGSSIKKQGVKKVFDMHEFYEIQGSKRKLRIFIRTVMNYLYSKFDFVIYVNNEQIKNIKSKYKQKLVFLPNYPEIEEYNIFQGIKSENIRISYIGAVRQYNELKNLMEVAKDFNQISVKIHGEGVAFKKLKKLSAKYNNTEVTGVFNYSMAGELYSKTDVLYAVYPIDNRQNRIAYPVKFFEAIASATPIIVSKGTVLEEEVLKNDLGFVVDSNSAEELRKVLKNIVDDRLILLNKEENIKKNQNTYDWKAVVENLNIIYI